VQEGSEPFRILCFFFRRKISPERDQARPGENTLVDTPNFRSNEIFFAQASFTSSRSSPRRDQFLSGENALVGTLNFRSGRLLSRPGETTPVSTLNFRSGRLLSRPGKKTPVSTLNFCSGRLLSRPGESCSSQFFSFFLCKIHPGDSRLAQAKTFLHL